MLIKGRVYFVFFLFLILGGISIWKLYFLTIKNGEYYQVLALGQHFSFKEEIGSRGEIFLAKDNLILAQTKRIFQNKNFLHPLNVLGKIFNQKEEEVLLKHFEKGRILKREISQKDLEKIKKEKIQGTYFNFSERFYPHKTFAAQVIGFVNQKGEGQYGIEGYYNELLKGKTIFKEKGKSPFGYFVLTTNCCKKNNLKGADIFLTLDYNIQYFAEKLLKEAEEKWQIDSGQIIVQQPSTGKILALANYPKFDPNEYFAQKDFRIFLNGAIQKLFEPGSVFKPITMAGALQEGLITPETTYQDKGFINTGGPLIYNFEKKIWAKQNMIGVLEKSINTGAVFVQQKLGEKLFLEYLKKFGFFEKTGVDLQGEIFSQNETLKKGHPRDLAVASFGQGIQITPLQLTRAYGAIANGGKLMRPYVVEKIVTREKEIEIKPKFQRQVISPTTAGKLTSMLISVVEHGSGRKAKIPGYFIAGKTGTAQVPQKKGGYFPKRTIQSFLGYFPALNPKILIFIKLDNPKGIKIAAFSAAPLFKKLAKYIIDLYQIPPSYEEGD